MYYRLGKSQQPHVLLFSRNEGWQIRPAPTLTPGPRVITDFSHPHNFRIHVIFFLQKLKPFHFTVITTFTEPLSHIFSILNQTFGC